MYSGGVIASNQLRNIGGGPSPGGGAPVFVDANTVSGNDAEATVNIAYPSGLANNDVAILYASYRVVTADQDSITAPGGWNEIENAVYNSASHSFRHVAWWRRLDGTETGNITVSSSPSQGGTGVSSHAVNMSIWRGCKTTGDPFEQSGVSRRGAVMTTAGVPIRNIADPDRTLIHFYTMMSTGGTVTQGDGYTRQLHVSAGTLVATRRVMTSRALTVPGHFGEEVTFHSDATTSNGWSGIYFSLVPETEISSTTPAPVDPYIGNTVFLSGFEGEDGQETTMEEINPNRVVSRVAGTTVEIDTATNKGGVSCLRRSAGLFTVPDSADWHFGADPFTLEMWVAFATAPTTGFHYLLAQYDTGANQRSWAFLVNSGNLGLLLSSAGTSGTAKASAAWSPSTSTWYHVAADWDGTNYRTYAGGTMIGKEATGITLLDSTAALGIGSALNSGAANGSFNGWIDEVRITKGVARYASDSGYTVPSAPFPRS